MQNRNATYHGPKWNMLKCSVKGTVYHTTTPYDRYLFISSKTPRSDRLTDAKIATLKMFLTTMKPYRVRSSSDRNMTNLFVLSFTVFLLGRSMIIIIVRYSFQ